MKSSQYTSLVACATLAVAFVYAAGAPAAKNVSAFDASAVAGAPRAPITSAAPKASFDLSQARGPAVAGTAGAAAANGNANGRKARLAPSGVWTWTTFNGSMQLVINSITLTADKSGKVSGKLIDAFGEHELKDVTLGDGTVSFDVKYHSRGVGELTQTFTVDLDPDVPGVAVDRPDLSPLGKTKGGKRHEQHKAKHDPAG